YSTRRGTISSSHLSATKRSMGDGSIVLESMEGPRYGGAGDCNAGPVIGLFLPRGAASARDAAGRKSMGAAGRRAETCSTGRTPDGHRLNGFRSATITGVPMKSFARIAQSLVLALMLAGPAVAAEQVDINTADAPTIDAALLNIGP